MNAQIEKQYEKWFAALPAGDPMREELEAIRGDDAAVTDRFYQDITFGTAGLRGICGAGTNRMNRLTVGRATQGIANYIRKNDGDKKDSIDNRRHSNDRDGLSARGVVIAYDCRYHSKEFSELSAEILAGNGIHVFLFPSLRPTPELSFAIRRLHAAAGINMTASHNPKEYNGYKVYWQDGAQISGNVSDGMAAEIAALDLFDPPKRIPLQEAMKNGLVIMLGEDMDRAFLDYAESMAQRPDSELDRAVPIVYTPLNGAGSIPLSRVMEERGFSSFHIVPEQKDPDPEFTTVGYPNPEDPKAFRLAEELGRKTGAEVLIATDPDADRMAVEIPDGKGGYVPLNGNQTGALLIAYMAEAQKENGTLPEKAAMIKSIVTGDFGRAVCDAYGIRTFEALTGFKNICGRIPELQEEGYTYFFGYEESIGCAPGEQVRDKDGITAGMLIAEMAAFYRKQGRTIADELDSLYRRFGYYAEDQVSIVLKGQEGAEEIGRIMDAFRSRPPQKFGVFQVAETIDYLHGFEDIPASNVLKFVMTDGTWFAMRPSGTEPKIKFYYYTVSGSREQSQHAVSAIAEAVSRMVQAVR